MAAQFDLIAGLDLSALSSVTQAQLMQAINQIAPLSNIGGILFQSTTPDVAGNPRFARYVWMDSSSDPAVPKYYNSGAGTWSAVSVSALSITDAQISASAAIAVSKLAPGTARYVLRTNAAGTSPEYVTPSSILNSDELAVIKLTSNGGTSAYLKSSAGVTQWVSEATERAAIAAALSGLNPTVLTPGSNNTLLGTNGSGVVGFAAINSLLANNAVGLNLLAAGGAAASDVLKFDGSNWVKITPGLRVFDSHAANAGITTPATGTGLLSGAAHSFAHGLASIPRSFRVVAYNTNAVAEAGYNQNDEVDIFSFYSAAGNLAIASISADATYVYVSFNNVAMDVSHKTTGVDTTITEANWQLKVYAFK